MKVDSSAIGKRITIYGLKRVNSNDSRHFIYFYSSEGNLLTSSDLTWVHQNNGKPNSCNSFKYFTIPRDCESIGFRPGGYGGYIYNITY